MKKILLLAILVLIVFAVYCRQRLYVRDPMGSVLRNGVKEDGTQVFLNYNNDVLLENDNSPSYITVVQHGGNIGTPARLMCLHWLLCMTDANEVTLLQPLHGAVVDMMSNKVVQYHAGAQKTLVTLR